jgi:hypothetical protein
MRGSRGCWKKEFAMRMAALLMIPLLFAVPAATEAKKDRLTDEQRLAKALDGMTPGKPRSCIRLRDARDTDAFGDTLIFRVSNREVYKTDGKGCGGRESDAFVTRTFGSELCRGDIVRRADLMSGFETGFCTVGPFTPYTRPKTN